MKLKGEDGKTLGKDEAAERTSGSSPEGFRGSRAVLALVFAVMCACT